MKKISLAFLLSLLFSATNAQQQFIEVNVTDTMLAEPDFFIYKIFYENRNEDVFEDIRYKNPELFQKKMKQLEDTKKSSFDSLKNELMKAGFKIVPPTIFETYSQFNNEDNVYSMSIYTGSVDTVAILYNKIKKSSSIVGSLVTAKTKDEMVYQKLLYNKLIEQATAKANLIAASIHRKLVAVVSVTENATEKAQGGWTAYPPLSALSSNIVPGWHTTIFGINKIVLSDKKIVTAYPITNTLTVKFAIE